MDNIIQTPHLVTDQTPYEILSEDFPKHDWPISGGWGYDRSSPCIIEADNEYDGVSLEMQFIQYRTYEELIVFRDRDDCYAGINIKKDFQALMHIDNRYYDKVDYTVSAWPKADWEMLKMDWISHKGYADDAEGARKHLSLKLSKMVTYKTTGYFDITSFYGK